MTQESPFPALPVIGKSRIQRARRMVGDLASRVADPEEARRIEAELNDAWLRLQFALVAEDARLARSERQAYADLVDKARRRAREDERSRKDGG